MELSLLEELLLGTAKSGTYRVGLPVNADAIDEQHMLPKLSLCLAGCALHGIRFGQSASLHATDSSTVLPSCVDRGVYQY
jgi:hypothetical protein